MAIIERDQLNQELNELFDLKKAKARKEKDLTYEANEALKEIRHLMLMFRDGIPDVSIPISEIETLEWRERAQQLVHVKEGHAQVVEGTTKDVMVRLRPYLIQLVKKAKEYYRH